MDPCKSNYSGSCAIQYLSFPTFDDIEQKLMVPRYLLTKIKPEYSDILCNPTQFPGPLVCQIRQVPGLTLEGVSHKGVVLWRLTSLSHWSKAKFKSPCNFEESPYVAARVFSPLVIYENVDIVHVFIEIYSIRY